MSAPVEMVVAGDQWNPLDLCDARVDEIGTTELVEDVGQVHFCRLTELRRQCIPGERDWISVSAGMASETELRISHRTIHGIQRLSGDNDVRTTTYTHVIESMTIIEGKNPLDF